MDSTKCAQQLPRSSRIQPHYNPYELRKGVFEQIKTLDENGGVQYLGK